MGMGIINQISAPIFYLIEKLFGFVLLSTEIVYIFLFIWIIKESILRVGPYILRQGIRLLLLPGDVLHSIAHLIAARMLGYTVDVRLAIITGGDDRSMLVTSGDDIPTRHSIFIGCYPLFLNGVAFWMLKLSKPFFQNIQSVNVFLVSFSGMALWNWLLIAIAFYILPDWDDWMFIFHTMIDRYPYSVYGYLIGGLCWILWVGWIGLIPTTLIVSIYFVLVYYRTGRDLLESVQEKDSVSALLDDLDLDPELDVLIYDTT